MRASGFFDALGEAAATAAAAAAAAAVEGWFERRTREDGGWSLGWKKSFGN